VDEAFFFVVDPGVPEGVDLLPGTFCLFGLSGACGATLLELEGLTAPFLFLFSVRMVEGSSSPSSAWVSQQVFPVHPNWRHLLHWEGFCICLSPLIFTLSTAETTPIGLLPCWLSKLWKPPLPSSKLLVPGSVCSSGLYNNVKSSRGLPHTGSVAMSSTMAASCASQSALISSHS